VDLTSRQRAAVERLGQDVCVVAGPGSGKTRVLVERFAWLIAERKINPLRILAITFTDKAATEIKLRLAKRFDSGSGLRADVERAYVSTVHGFCARLLREHAITAGVDPEFVVLEEAQSKRDLTEAVHGALESLYQAHPAEIRSLLEALYVSSWEGGRQPDLSEALLRIYEAARVAGQSVADLRRKSRQPLQGGLSLEDFLAELNGILGGAPAKLTPKQEMCIQNLRQWARRSGELAARPASWKHFKAVSEYPGDLPSKVLSPDLKDLREKRKPLLVSTLAADYFASLRALLLDALERTDALYRERKREMDGMDFSDLEEKAIELLEAEPGAREAIRSSFDYILMDELQDTNPLQWRLLELLRSPRSFFAVGDINQSIFGFRHAEPEVFRRYRQSVEESGGQIDELGENFRSRPEILAAVEAVMVACPQSVLPSRLIARKTFSAKAEPSVEVIAAYGANTEEAAGLEGYWIARRIGELVGNLKIEGQGGAPRLARFRDMAILVRTVNALPPIADALREFKIPCIIEGGKTFYEAREVRDLIHLLMAIANPLDEVALAGVLRSPLAGLSDEALLRMKVVAGSLAAAVEGGDVNALAGRDSRDEERLLRFRELFDELRRLKDSMGPDRLLLRALDACDYEGALEEPQRTNVAKLLSLLREQQQASPVGLDRAVDTLLYLRDAGGEAEAAPEDSSETVRIMTMHKAKGLEFPIVFLAALHRPPGGSRPVIRLSRAQGLGVLWRDPVTGDPVRDLAYLDADRNDEERESAEEHRLLYVAMTRAEEHLILSFANAPAARGEYKRLMTERFALPLGTNAENRPVVHMVPQAGLPIRLLCVDQQPEPPVLSYGTGRAEREVTLVPRPVAPDQHDSAAPVTSVQLFANCPRRYYLERYVGRERLNSRPWDGDGEALAGWADREGMDAAEFGTLVHHLLAGKTVVQAPPEAHEMVKKFQESPLGIRAGKAARIEREYDFVMSVEDIVLRGQIDLWFEEGGELILADYKTDHAEAADAPAHARKYGVQLRLYAAALERALGRRPDHAYVFFLRPGVAAPVSLGANEMRETAALVQLFREAQSSLRFELNEGPACRTCPFYRGRCPAGREN